MYTEEQIETTFNIICERIEDGESLRSVLKDKDMPSSQTFYIWVDGNDIKSKQYARACELRAENEFEDILKISDNIGKDLITLPDGREVVDNAVIARDRLRVDARKWRLSKMNPKKYGDKVGVEHSGEIKTINPIDLSKLSDKELEEYYKIQSKIEGE